jgi:type VI secretion system protein ImpB
VAIQDELPESRITLKYRTTINGEKEDIKLPLRTLILGDFSQGASKDREVDLDQRQLRTLDGTNRVDDLMKDMRLTVDVQVPNVIDPEQDDIRATVPISGMKSFSPDEVGQHIPQVKALMMFKQLLNEMQSNIDNRKELRKIIQDLCANPEAMAKTLTELAKYKNLKLPGLKAGRDEEGQG